MKLTQGTLQNMVMHRRRPTTISKQDICLDKGYDFPEVYELLQEYDYTIHIPKGREDSYIGVPK
ncbi:MAG: hypothetical protein ABJB85_02570 [Nitrososphaerota archaeon]